MKNNKLNKIVFFCLMLAVPFSAMADDIDNGNGDVQDVAAPIDNYLSFAIIAAIGIAYIIIQKKSVRM